MSVDEYVIGEDGLREFVRLLGERYELFAPVDKETRVVWGKIKDFAEISRRYLNSEETTLLPPKKFFFRPMEVMLQFNRRSAVWSKVDADVKPFVVFGVHPCDIHGILLMDKVFGGEYKDDYYFQKREKSVIVGLDCMPTPYSFEKSMGTDRVSGGYDIFLTDIGGRYYVEVGTKKGDTLLSAISGWLRPVADGDREVLREFRTRKDKAFRRRISVKPEELPRILDEAYYSEVWKKLGHQCVGCTRCSIVCPTCYCFNVEEDFLVDMENGIRFRMWDSCLRVDFAVVAGGYNFRGTLDERIRHRYYHKERVFSQEYGRVSCVGCGRCSRDCIAGIKPDEVINELVKVVRRDDHSSVSAC